LIRWHPLLQFSIYVPTIVSAGAALWLVLRKPGLPRFASWLRPALQG
jgi:hypothetical protein